MYSRGMVYLQEKMNDFTCRTGIFQEGVNPVPFEVMRFLLGIKERK
jgi:hypothetical protein